MHRDCISCVLGVWLTGFAGFIFTSWRQKKIWLFALPLPFNLSCRMERLFNSSITRKCPSEEQGAGRGGWVFRLPHPTPIYQPVISAGGQRTVESQEVLHGKSPYAVNPLIFQWGFQGSVGLLWFFLIYSNAAVLVIILRKGTFWGALQHFS